MNLKQPLFAALALPLIACGAPTDGNVNDGTSSEDMISTITPQPPRTADFDTDDSGGALVNGTDVNLAYFLKGVTLTCQGSCFNPLGGRASVYARVLGHSGNGVSIRIASSGQNVPQPEFDASSGVVRATFGGLASTVTIDAFGMHNLNSSSFIAPQGAPWLKAYDIYGNEIAEDNYTAPLGQWQTLSVNTGAYNIAYVEFSSSTPTAFPYGMMGRFDNLTFDQPPVKKPPPILPAPTGTTVTPPPRLL